LNGQASYVSVAMDNHAGIAYGTPLCIPELNRKYNRVIVFKVSEAKLILIGLVIALCPQTPKHIRGGWSHYTDISEPDGNGVQNMVTVQSGFEPATFRSLAHELTNCSNRAHWS
jgi:hypothetical protein